jgi:hypothetical protein
MQKAVHSRFFRHMKVIIKLGSILIGFMLLLQGAIFFSNQISKERVRIIEIEEKANTYIGEDIVLGTDTLTIIRYYQDSDMYRLSNDQVVSFQVIKKKVLKY